MKLKSDNANVCLSTRTNMFDMFENMHLKKYSKNGRYVKLLIDRKLFSSSIPKRRIFD